METRHNPYFNRWFSAIINVNKNSKPWRHVTILILIDGFLQCTALLCPSALKGQSQSLF